VTLPGRVCAIALLLASGAVQAQQAPPPPPPPPPSTPAGPPSQQPAPASLFGRVVTTDTGQPVRFADIRLVGEQPGTGTLVAKTDDDGRFELPAVNLGSYSLQVIKAGFVSTTFGLSKDQPGTFGLSAGQRINLGDMKLPRGGVIAGRVFDAKGDPAAEIVVSAERLDFLSPLVRRVVSSKSIQTNDLGDFRIHGLSPGKYYVSAALRVPGAFSAPVFYPGVSNMSDALPIEVRAGQDSSGITIPLAPSAFGAVTGTVVDSKGAPFGAANVWLVSSRTDGVQVNSAVLRAATDAAGRFTIPNVTPGDYRLEVFSVAWMEKLAREGDIRAGPPPELASVRLTVADGRTEALSVGTSAGFRVRGQVFVDGAPVTGESAAGIRISASAPLGANLSGLSVPISTQLSPDGTFVLSGVQGPRLVRTAAAPAGAFFHHTSIAGMDVTERGVEVTADITGMEIHLTSRPTRLEGNVVDAAGTPVPAAKILVFSIDRADWLMPGNRRYRNFSVTGLGKFSAVGLPAGNYLAATVPDEDADRWADPDYLDGLRARATPFTLTDGSTTTLVLTRK
jgi:hypothetical protein